MRHRTASRHLTRSRLRLALSWSRRPRHHHVELLVDAGHAQWLDEFQRGARITNAGYDFLNAVDNQPKAKQRFLDAYRASIPYAEAVLKAMAGGTGKQILGWITRL